MAAEEAKVVDAVPPPPAYYKLFSPDAAGCELHGTLVNAGVHAAAAKAGEGAERGAASPTRDGFPLEPPRPPGPGETYKMFGMPYSSEPVAEELLPPEKMVVPTSGAAVDFRAELKGLLNSIMANYGQFMEMLVSSPSRAHEKLSDVETLFVNFHSLLNRYRAHQARHIILERLRDQAKENDSVMSALEAAMRQCASAKGDATACLDPPRNAIGGVDNARRDPMDVVDDGDVAVRKGGGVDGEGRGATTGGANGGGLVGKAGLGKGKLRTVLPTAVESGNGR
ncbi:unnamed protein product [Scytosiphon promiscuus]